MRRLSAVLVASLATVSIALTGIPVSATAHSSSALSLAQCQNQVRSELKASGKLTVATSNPPPAPWFVNYDPTNQKGYESALAYLVARELAITPKSVRWLNEPYLDSYAPGPKSFDFDVSEIVATPERAANVSLSNSYYDLQQSIVAMKGSVVVKRHTPADLTHYVYGALANSVSWNYIITKIKPTHPPVPFTSSTAVVTALKSHAINAFIIDTPTGNAYVNFYLLNASTESSSAVQVGQFPAVGDLYYAMVSQKGSALTACLNVALNAAKQSGQLKNLKAKWLSAYNSVPLLTP